MIDRLLAAFPGSSIEPSVNRLAKCRLSEALKAEPKLVSRKGGAEVWARGPLTFVLPAVHLGHPLLAEAIRLTREAWLAPGCPNCEVWPHISRGVAIVAHKRTCPAARLRTTATIENQRPAP